MPETSQSLLNAALYQKKPNAFKDRSKVFKEHFQDRKQMPFLPNHFSVNTIINSEMDWNHICPGRHLSILKLSQAENITKKQMLSLIAHSNFAYRTIPLGT